MNELDSEVMAGMLERRGLSRTEDEGAADLLIYNTCWIRELAARKVMGKIGQLGRKSKRPIIGLTGCMANAKKGELFKKLPHIDFVLGTNNIHDLDRVLNELEAGERHIVRADDLFTQELPYEEASRKEGLKAYVSIIRGCNKFCTYCCVPYTRGREVSRDPQSIVEECVKLSHQGIKEITLLGQNVNSYGKDQSVLFHDLLYQLDAIKGIDRIRFLTSHPVDITRNLMEAIRDLPSLCEFVHFPLQAGSSRILKKMHRIYTKEEYFEKVALLREIVPNVSLGTDMIVGFPTETEEEFQESIDAMRKIRYSVAYLYTYSPRKNTPAERWKDDVPEEVKQDRLHRLLRLHNQITLEDHQSLIGKELNVLIERKAAKTEDAVRGRSRCWKKVVCPGDISLIGTEQKVRITSVLNDTLIGVRESVQKKSLQEKNETFSIEKVQPATTLNPLRVV